MWLKAAITLAKRRAERFVKEDSAAVSVDFVVAIPILLAVLVFTSEYGRVLQMRTVLDNAVADATRYLARAPLNPDGSSFPPAVVNVAEQIITTRITTPFLAIGAPVVGTAATGASSQFRTVSLSVSVGVETPAISVISLMTYGDDAPKLSGTDNSGQAYEVAYSEIEGFVLTASETSRHFGQ